MMPPSCCSFTLEVDGRKGCREFLRRRMSGRPRHLDRAQIEAGRLSHCAGTVRAEAVASGSYCAVRKAASISPENRHDPP